MLQGTTAGKYASQRFSASYAAQPKGCSACWVPRPQNQYRKLNRPTKGAHINLGLMSGEMDSFADRCKTIGSSTSILPKIHFLNQMSLFDLDISLRRAENRVWQFRHLYRWIPLRTPHFIASRDPQLGQRKRLLIFGLSLIRWNSFHLIYVSL